LEKLGGYMGLDREIDALRKRLNRIVPIAVPPTLLMHVFRQGEKNPTGGGPWEMSLMIENKKT